MRLGSYKELSFPPVHHSTQKQIPHKSQIKERSPSPVDLCTKKNAEQKPIPKKHINMPSTISSSPFDYLPPYKKSQIEDTRIIPAHQGQS